MTKNEKIIAVGATVTAAIALWAFFAWREFDMCFGRGMFGGLGPRLAPGTLVRTFVDGHAIIGTVLSRTDDGCETPQAKSYRVQTAAGIYDVPASQVTEEHVFPAR